MSRNKKFKDLFNESYKKIIKQSYPSELKSTDGVSVFLASSINIYDAFDKMHKKDGSLLFKGYAGK